MRKQKVNFNQKTKMSNLKRFNESFDDHYDDGDDYMDDDIYSMGDRVIEDGVWDLEDIKVHKAVSSWTASEKSRWKKQFPDFGVAGCGNALIYLSRKPTKRVPFTDHHTASSFEEQGSLAEIENCPRRILIVGQGEFNWD